MQRQARELISGPIPAAETRLLSRNRTQSRVVIGLITGHTNLRKHLHLMRLNSGPLCRRCGAEYETSAHILCECEALASLRHVYMGSFFLDLEHIKSLTMGAIWNFSEGTGFPCTGVSVWGTNGPFLRPRCIGTVRDRTQMLINQIYGITLKVQFSQKRLYLSTKLHGATFQQVALNIDVTQCDNRVKNSRITEQPNQKPTHEPTT